MSSEQPPQKRATVAQVDRKIDELTEQLDIMSSDIKEIMKNYIEMRLKESEIQKPKDDGNNRMYGWSVESQKIKKSPVMAIMQYYTDPDSYFFDHWQPYRQFISYLSIKYSID